MSYSKILPIKRDLKIDVSVHSHDPETDFMKLSISEEPHFRDWLLTPETLQMVNKMGQELKKLYRRKKK